MCPCVQGQSDAEQQLQETREHLAHTHEQVQGLEAQVEQLSVALKHEQATNGAARKAAEDAERARACAQQHQEVAEAMSTGAQIAKRQAQESLLREERRRQAVELHVEELKTVVARLQADLVAVRAPATETQGAHALPLL